MCINKTNIPGCLEIVPKVFRDERGVFVKIFHNEKFLEHNLEAHFNEEYYSVSCNRVLRGLHFQKPPMEHVKLVYCVFGNVIDAVVDLRIGSPTFGQFETFELSAAKANIIYIPAGLAHGFYVKSQNAILIYKVSTVYASEYDSGILWNSVGIPWPDASPIISSRDRQFLPFSTFESPFCYKLD